MVDIRVGIKINEIMIPRVKFIKEVFPLSNRVWIELNERVKSETILNSLQKHLSSINQPLQLEVHIVLKINNSKTSSILLSVLSELYKIKVGYDKSYPIISIYYNVDDITTNEIEKINCYDKYRPGVNFFLLVTESFLDINDDFLRLRCKAKIINDYLLKCHSLALNSTAIFFLESDPKFFDLMVDLEKIVNTFDTSISLNNTIFQINPNLIHKLNENTLIKIINKVIKNKHAVDVMNTLCGFSTLIFRYNENRVIPSTTVPLGGCGIGNSEKYFCSDGKCRLCYFSSKITFTNNLFERCKNCKYVSNCTGCLIGVNDKINDCKLEKLFILMDKIVYQNK